MDPDVTGNWNGVGPRLPSAKATSPIEIVGVPSSFVIVPTALASASVWQDPHFSENSTLPLTTLVPLSLSPQPDRAIAVTTPPMTTRP